MASLSEAMGIALTTNAAIPAADSRRLALCERAGRRIVELVREDVRMADILTRAAFENAIVVNGAIGGSSNAVLHLLALAGRIGVPLSLDDWDRLGRDVPCLVDLKPSGRFLMEEFYYAGGLPALMRRISERLSLDAPTVDGVPLGKLIAQAESYDDEVIRPLENPVSAQGGMVVLRGNLAPRGAVLKPSAASAHLMRHRGKAVVFASAEEFRARIDDPDLEVDETSVLVLQNAGPVGYPGMPEVGNLALPKKLLDRGVKDMVRISDGRMSGTAYGTVVLHVAPEAAVGGPLALVRTGDIIALDVERRSLMLEVSDEELAARRAAWTPPPRAHSRGYGRLFLDHVQQADGGVDFDVLVGGSGTPVSKVSF
jgi:dihydroxy-acid dehydratase